VTVSILANTVLSGPSGQGQCFVSPDPLRARSRLRRRRSSLTALLLFFLIFSGPPRLRIRDGDASLRGDIDGVVILHVVVWAWAGIWLFYQVWRHPQSRRRMLQFSLPQKVGLAMVFCLALAAGVARAPALAAFKIYQILVSLGFMHVFVQRFGRRWSLKAIFWCSALLCFAVAIGAFLSPDLVWFSSDFNPDPSRLRGELIASTGVVSSFAIILLLTGVRKIWRAVPALLVALFLALLVLSQMRTAYVVVSVFLALALVKRTDMTLLRRFAFLSCVLTLTLYAYHWLPSLSQYRDPGSIADLDDRVGLWRHLAGVTFTQSPWLGLGYYSASRIYGPEYNPGLGTAHSMFLEVLLGGGVLGFALLIALCTVLSVWAARLLYSRRDGFSFAVVSLFIACMLFGFMGEEIDSGPVAMCFWYSAAVLPWLGKKTSRGMTKQTLIGNYYPPIATAAKQPQGQTP